MEEAVRMQSHECLLIANWRSAVAPVAQIFGRKEYCGLVVRDIAGNAVYSNDEILKSVRVALPVEPVSRMRKIELIKPARFVCEDMSFGMSGVPGFLFLSPELYWR